MCNKMKRKIKGAVSVLLAAAMLVGLVPAGLGGGSTVAQAAATSEKVSPGHGQALRAVLNKITELPYVDSVGGKIKINEEKYNAEKGTAERPFTILEIVGYEEQAEFGYLISGCEPVKVEDMAGLQINGGGAYYMMDHLKTADISPTAGLSGEDAEVYFFLDEKDGNKDYYSVQIDWNAENIAEANETSHTMFGYYERVADGTGTHKVSGGSIVKATGGNLVWHTINKYAKENYYPYNTVSYVENLTSKSLKKIGDRYYSMRLSNATTDPVVHVKYAGYIFYHNNEAFLTRTVGLTNEEAENYSVVIKTITPEELNARPEWVDCADLIYVFAATQTGGNNPKLWMSQGLVADEKGSKRLNRVGHAPAFSYYDINNYSADVYMKPGKDISWTVVEKIMDKITAEKNYAALIMDDGVFNSFDSRSVSVMMYDYNLEQVGPKDNETGGRNNFYKLALMTLSLNPNLIKQIFWEYISEGTDGKGTISLQTGGAASYWSPMTFALMEPGHYAWEAYKFGDTQNADGWGKDYWESLNGNGNITTVRSYAYGHVYTYNSNAVIGMAYADAEAGIDAERFSDFDQFVKDRYGENSGKDASNVSPADAVAYILGLGDYPGPYYGGEMNVLDIEPGVGLDADSKPDWKLTETSVRLMMPNFTGSVNITHMTTAEFIGKIEDLNSTYDMIYIGMDAGAYNTKTVREAWTNWTDKEVTDFNDDSMDGKVYFHVGDRMVNTGERTSVDFLLEGGTGETLRFPGNDITALKKAELDSFLASGKPIAATLDFFNKDAEEFLVDQSSYIHDLTVNSGRALKEQGIDENRVFVFNISDIALIDASLKATRSKVVLKDEWLPAIYNGATYRDGVEAPDATSLSSPNYLSGNKLKFEFDVKADNYAFRIYVDQNRDGKFSGGEVVYGSDAKRGHNSYSYSMDASLLGMIQWKLEVYSKDNPNIRSERSGCSAVDPSMLSEKKIINVLQILPVADGSALDISKSELFWKYYRNPDVKEFDITVTAITWDDFEEYFADVRDNAGNLVYDRSFSFNISKPVSVDPLTAPENQNPKLDQLMAVESGYNDIVPLLAPVQRLGKNGSMETVEVGDLSQYNMIIVGFKDNYGSKDLSNMSKDPTNKAVQYLQYFAASGRSILYTHDVTGYYNIPAWENGEVTLPGVTANAMLREQMGMNRYGAISMYLQYMGGEADLVAQMRAYQGQTAHDRSSATHGFTYYAMKRLGWYYTNDGSNPNNGNKVPYRYMITNPQGESVAGTWINRSRFGGRESDGGFASASGFNGNYDITTTASKLNEGQITAYPYKIDENLIIAPTHGQCNQLNMEDEEVTVWYCLSDPAAIGMSNPRVGLNNWGTAAASQSNGSALTYGVSPNDAANNYYIYSKGNIFYSGVGHTKVEGTGADMEAKLFVNTMVAAYRQSYMAPRVEITNPEAVRESSTEYHMQVLREFNRADASYNVEDLGGDKVRVYFKPKDGSFSNNLSVRIRYDGTSEFISDIWRNNAANTHFTAQTINGEPHIIPGLENDQEYYFDYPKSYLDAGKRTIFFEVWNDVSSSYGITYLYMDVQPLFDLD